MDGCTYVPMSVMNSIALCLTCIPVGGIIGTLFNWKKIDESGIHSWFVIFLWVIILVGFNWAVFSSVAPAPEACSYIING